MEKRVVLGYDVSHVRGNKTGVEYYSLQLYEALKLIASDDCSIIPFAKEPVPEIPVFREIADNAAYFVSPDPESLRECILSYADGKIALPNPEKCKNIASRFKWVFTAEKTMQVYRNIVDGRKISEIR